MVTHRRLFFRLVPAGALALGIALAPLGLTPAAAATSNPHSAKVAFLNGAKEVAPGDEDGRGLAVVRVDAEAGEVCYLLMASRLDGSVVAAHIHKAPAGVNGPVVVPLTPPADGVVHACAAVDPVLANDIAANAAGYYVNVHTTAFPAGAVRGQLRG